MNTAGRFWAIVAADATGERELLKEALHSCHRNARIVRLSLDSFGGSDQFSVASNFQAHVGTCFCFGGSSYFAGYNFSEALLLRK
jgi:hypothetical protein